MDSQYTPNIVSMDELREAVSASVSASMEEQQAATVSAMAPIGPTMGYHQPYPIEP
jgi:hypothetical protein